MPADAVAEAVPSLEESIEVSSDVPDVPDVAEEVATVSLVGAVPALEASVVESLVATEATETEAEPEVGIGPMSQRQPLHLRRPMQWMNPSWPSCAKRLTVRRKPPCRSCQAAGNAD